MKRKRLKQVAMGVAADAASRGYDYWFARTEDEPVTFSKYVDGEEVQMEILVLERTEAYVHLGVSASGPGFFSPCCPVGTSVLVERHESTE